MNNCTFIGRLTKDPEIRYTKDNKAVCTFTIAINRYNGMADFIRIEAWGTTAENCAKYLVKGRQAGVVGSLHNNRYEKDGVKHSFDYVYADRVEFLEWGEKKEATPQAQRFEAEQFEQAEQARQNINNVLGINAKWDDVPDDLPF